MSTAPYDRAEAVARALASKSYAVAMCMQWTRLMFGIGAVGDFDGNGRANAVDGWKSCRHRHPGDRNPPAGVPVFWSGGSRGDGHAAVALGGGMIRSIDRPRAGVVGTVPLSDIERSWGLTYLGWAEDIGGVLIPTPPPPAPPAPKRRPPRVRNYLQTAKRQRDRAIQAREAARRRGEPLGPYRRMVKAARAGLRAAREVVKR